MKYRPADDPEIRSQMAHEIEEGLRSGRWEFRSRIAGALSRSWADEDYEADEGGPCVTHADVDRIIEEAETGGLWPVGWVDSLIPRRPPPKPDKFRRAVPGERYSTAKLTVDQVREIRRQWAARDTTVRKTTVSALARRFGVSRPAIQKILDGRSWRHV